MVGGSGRLPAAANSPIAAKKSPTSPGLPRSSRAGSLLSGFAGVTVKAGLGGGARGARPPSSSREALGERQVGRRVDVQEWPLVVDHDLDTRPARVGA